MKTIKVMSLVLAVGLLAAVLAAGGCTINTGKPETPTPAPSTGPSKTETPEATEGGPKVVILEIGDQFDETSKEITNKTDTFATTSPSMYVNAGITGLTTDATITGTLYAVDVTMKDGTHLRDEKVVSTDIKAPAEVSTARFEFTAPKDGWPKGTYKVDVAVEGKTIDTAELKVE